MAFRPLFTRDRIIAFVLLLLLFALVAALGSQVLTARPVGPKTVGFLIALLPTLACIVLLAYRLWQLQSLDYWLDRDALCIHWAGDVITIPLGHVVRIEAAGAGDVGGPDRLPDWRQWPLPWLRPRRAGQRHAVYATQPPAACLAVETAESSYLISPRDPAAFLEAFQARQDFGALRELSEQIEASTLRDHWLWHDRLAQFLLAASLFMGLVLLGYFLWHFPGLPVEVPLHFDARGLVDRIGPRRTLMLLPAITLLMWFFNVVMGFVFYERQRLATYLLWGNALAVQIAGLLIGRNLLQLVT